MNKEVVFAISFILIISIANVSAFNLIDWIKEALQKIGRAHV